MTEGLCPSVLEKFRLLADGGGMVNMEHVDGGAMIIALAGDLDCSAADQLRDATNRAAARTCRVVIEMSAVTDVPTPVLGVLVGAWHTLEDRLTLRCSQPVQDVLERTGLDRLLPVA